MLGILSRPEEAAQLLRGSDSCLSAGGRARPNREEVNGSDNQVGQGSGRANAFDLITRGA